MGGEESMHEGRKKHDVGKGILLEEAGETLPVLDFEVDGGGTEDGPSELDPPSCDVDTGKEPWSFSTQLADELLETT